MGIRKMFDNEILDDLLTRILKELEESRQFDSLARSSNYIQIDTNDSRVYVRITLLPTYSSKSITSRASNLRIRFESSLFQRQLKTYMVPTWSRTEEMWLFSRSKLLTKAAAAIESVSECQKTTDKEAERRKVFARFIGDELGYLQERGEVKLTHNYDRRGKFIKKIVQIKLPHVHIDLHSPDNGQTFKIERIQPVDDKYADLYFNIEAIKEIITRLEGLFVPEEELVLQQ